MSPARAWWLAGGLAVVTAGVAYRLSRSTVTARVTSGPVEVTVVARAEVVPVEGIAEVRPRLDGRVVRVLVREGDRVTRGQVLAELEAVPAAAEVARREAEQRALEASAAAVREGARPEERAASAAELRAARHELSLAEARQARQGRLLASGSASPSAEEEARLAADVARARAEQALARWRLTQAGGREAEVRAAGARVRAAEAAVTEAREQLSRATLVASIDGVVLARRVDPGDVVTGVQAGPSPAVFELADVDRTELRVEVEESDALRVEAGLAVTLTPTGGGEPLGRGTVARVSPRLEARTIGADDARVRADGRVRSAWVALAREGAGARWPVGHRLEARLSLPPRTAAARVPRGAVAIRDGRARVSVPWLGFSREVFVELGAADERWVEVRGIAPGATVVVR